jgi:hypothetical protein
MVVVNTSFALIGCSSHPFTASYITNMVFDERYKASTLSTSMTADSITNYTRIDYNNIIKETNPDHNVVKTTMTTSFQQQRHNQSLPFEATPSPSASPLMKTTPFTASDTTISPPQRQHHQQQQQVHPISSMDELLAIMNGKLHPDDDTTEINNQLIVIKYYADYCKLCQRASMQMKRLVTEFPTTVRFAKIEQAKLTPPSGDTLRKLGVTKFPFIQIYRHGQCVASFSTGPSHMFRKRVQDTVKLCLERSPDAWQSFYEEFATPIQENANIRERLLTDIMQQRQL